MMNEFEDYVFPKVYRSSAKFSFIISCSYMGLFFTAFLVTAFVRIENMVPHLWGAIIFAVFIVVLALVRYYGRIDDIKYRCSADGVENFGSKVISENWVQTSKGVFLSRILYRRPKTFMDPVPLVIISQKPFPKLDIPTHNLDFWSLKELSNYSIVYIPLNEKTAGWLEAQFHTAQVPEYPKVLYKPAVLTMQNKESLDLWN